MLCTEGQRSNQCIMHDRIVDENYFGRLCKFWTIMSAKYRWREKNYGKVVRICIALMNDHVHPHPHRAGEGDSYGNYLLRIGSCGRERSRMRKRQQSEYHARRKSTLAMCFEKRINKARLRRLSGNVRASCAFPCINIFTNCLRLS